MSEVPEGGLRDYRIEFVRENDYGEAPTDPDFLKYSPTVVNFTWSSDSVNEPQYGLGSVDPATFLKGPESHEMTVEYALTKWFEDSGGAPVDAAYDGMERGDDLLLPNSHTVVGREYKENHPAAQTVSGNTSMDSRIYTVAQGGYIDEAVLSADPSDSQPIMIELTYLAQKVRSYQIDQPESATSLAVESSDSADTGIDVEIESEGAATQETVTLDGTTVQGTTETFGDIDAIHLSEETVGDVTVSLNTGDETSPSAGDALCVIYGSDTYNGIEGDRGVPPLGAGSHEDVASVGQDSYEQFIGDVIDYDSNPFPYEMVSAELSVANNVEETERADGYAMALHPAQRETELTATMFGASLTHDMFEEHLQNNLRPITWDMTGGTVELGDCVLDEAGERAAEEGEALMTTDNVFLCSDLNFNPV